MNSPTEQYKEITPAELMPDEQNNVPDIKVYVTLPEVNVSSQTSVQSLVQSANQNFNAALASCCPHSQPNSSQEGCDDNAAFVPPIDIRPDRSLTVEQETVEQEVTTFLQTLMSMFGEHWLKIVMAMTLTTSLAFNFKDQTFNFYNSNVTASSPNSSGDQVDSDTNAGDSAVNIVVGIDNIVYQDPFLSESYKEKIEAAVYQYGNDYINQPGVKIVVAYGYDAPEDVVGSNGLIGPAGIAYAVYELETTDPITGNKVRNVVRKQLYGPNFTPISN